MKIIRKITDNTVIAELDNIEFVEAWPVVQQLRSSLTLEDFLKFASEMYHYRVFVVVLSGNVIAYAGFSEQLNMYEGRHLFVYELVTDKKLRGNGYGKMLMEEICAEGRRMNCEMLVLTSNAQRIEAHRFYEEKVGLKKTSLVFRKEL